MDTVLTCLRQAFVSGSYAIGMAIAIVVVVGVVLFLPFRFIDPPASALMLRQSLSGREIDQDWVRLDDVSKHLIRAVVQSEDARFCRHFGVDVVELSNAVERTPDGGIEITRGASTISMQVVKNLYLWAEPSMLRKGLELVFTPVLEVLWPKRRILEVYLNVAEWGPGIFGVEAAARRHFGKAASQLTRDEALLLAAALPNPLRRKPSRPNRRLRRSAGRLSARVRRGPADLGCLAATSGFDRAVQVG